jgi:hypothetical protein
MQIRFYFNMQLFRYFLRLYKNVQLSLILVLFIIFGDSHKLGRRFAHVTQIQLATNDHGNSASGVNPASIDKRSSDPTSVCGQ